MKSSRFFVIFLILILSVAGFWWYLNRYVYKPKAGGASPLDVTFSYPKTRLGLNEEMDVGIAFLPQDVTTHNITSFDVKFIGEGSLDIVSVSEPEYIVEGGEFAGFQNLARNITQKNARVAYVSLPVTGKDGIIRSMVLRVRIKMSAAGNGKLKLDIASSEVAGSRVPGYSYTFGSVQEGEFTMDPTITVVPTPTGSVTPSVRPSPSISPGSGAMINMKIKLQGITEKKGRNLTIPVKVAIGRNAAGDVSDQQTVNFTLTDNGSWTGTAVFPITPDNTALPWSGGASFDRLQIYVKGPKHVQKKVCQTGPTETTPGGYRCNQGTFTFANGGTYNVDMSGIVMPAGDLPEQNGIINSGDITLVRGYLSKSDREALELADVNYDGVVNTQDYSLIIESLEVRPDD